MLLASALDRSIPPRYWLRILNISRGNFLRLGHWPGTWRRRPCAGPTCFHLFLFLISTI